MQRWEDRVAVWVGVLGGLGGFITALWANIPLQFFIPSVCAIVLLGFYFLLRWAHEQWDTSGISARAKTFTSTVERLHGGLRLVLVFTIIALASMGVAVKYGPSWVVGATHEALCEGSPSTDLYLKATSIPDQLKSLKKAGEPTSDVHFLVLRQQEVRFGGGKEILDEILDKGLDYPFWIGVTIVLSIFIVLCDLWITELIGQETYKIPLQP